MDDETENATYYRAIVSEIVKIKEKYDAINAFVFEGMRWSMQSSCIEQDKLARYAEQYSFTYRVSRRMEEWLLRETTQGKDGILEVHLSVEEVKYLQTITYLDALNEVSASFEGGISFMRH